MLQGHVGSPTEGQIANYEVFNGRDLCRTAFPVTPERLCGAVATYLFHLTDPPSGVSLTMTSAATESGQSVWRLHAGLGQLPLRADWLSLLLVLLQELILLFW